MRKRLAWLAGIIITSLTLTVVASDLGLPSEIADYYTWNRANVDKSFIDSAHPEMKDVYFNAAAAEGFEDGTFTLPHAEGSLFVKESTDPETLMVSVLTVMRKSEGANPDHGDWEWGMWGRAGMDEEHPDNGDDAGDSADMDDMAMAMRGFEGGWLSAEEAQSMCIDCHSNASDQDYTFLDYLTRQAPANAQD
jgi:hypothetical protein